MQLCVNIMNIMNINETEDALYPHILLQYPRRLDALGRNPQGFNRTASGAFVRIRQNLRYCTIKGQ